MTIDPFLTFDSSPYLTMPVLPLQTIIVLGKSLGARKPGSAPFYLDDAAAAMKEGLDDAQTAMVVRMRETNASLAGVDFAFDIGIDGLWALARDRLRGWAAYARDGLVFLDDEKDLEVDMDKLRERVVRASEVSKRIFGDGGLSFLSRPYAEQAQLMANALELIDADKHAADLLELTGPELLPILRLCQRRYEEMVQRRAAQPSGSQADLRMVRSRLGRLIIRYNTLVLTLLDEKVPETREIVEAALRPMITMRPRRVGVQGVEVDEPAVEEMAPNEGAGEGAGEGAIEGAVEAAVEG